MWSRKGRSDTAVGSVGTGSFVEIKDTALAYGAGVALEKQVDPPRRHPTHRRETFLVVPGAITPVCWEKSHGHCV